jgi:hypothetical protein
LGSRWFATLDRQGRSTGKRDWLVNELRSNAYANIDEHAIEYHEIIP